MKKNTGFTLIELMITLVIIAIIMAAATPSFQSISERKTLPQIAKLMEKAIKYGRSEARVKGTLITFSPIGSNWESGWRLTFVDPTTLQDTLIREFPPVPITVSINSLQFSATNPLTFEANGQATRVGSFEITQGLSNAVTNCEYTLNLLVSGMVQKEYRGC